MCQRLYIATRTELPSVRKRKGATELALCPAGPDLVTMRRHFNASEFPYLYVAEGHAPCGCGFPEESPGKRKPKRQAEDLGTMKRLQEAIRPAVRGRPRVQMVLCVVGEENEEIVPGPTIAIEELGSPGFQFRSLERLTVVKSAP